MFDLIYVNKSNLEYINTVRTGFDQFIFTSKPQWENNVIFFDKSQIKNQLRLVYFGNGARHYNNKEQ